MTEQPEAGELLVGAYHKTVSECELVAYNQRSRERGNQLEVDVIGVETTDGGDQRIYVCEVVTHLRGLNYSVRNNSGDWTDYGSYEDSLDNIWRKFRDDHEYVTNDLFDSADSYTFQLWSPVVPPGLEAGLVELGRRFESHTGTELQLLVNDRYSAAINDVRTRAASTEKKHGELGFRVLQILEHLP